MKVHAINPNRQGFALNYFSPTCPDPATALSYWRRRFRSADRYLPITGILELGVKEF